MCVCPDETCDLQSESVQRARKPWRCYECGSAVAIGERYVRIFTVYDGYPSTYRWCLGCHEWSKAFTAKQRELCGCGGYYFGALWDSIGEFAREHLAMPDIEGELNV